jgi:hypothetical protein
VNQFKIDVKCKLLQIIVTVLLAVYQPSQEVTDDVVQFLLNILDSKGEPVSTCLTSIDCLIEIELNMPVFILLISCNTLYVNFNLYRKH